MDSGTASSWGLAIVILASYLLDTALAEYDCSAKDDGWYYDPEFCHIYWRCIHGASEEFECASGTAWDHHDNRCNWLDSVDCSRAEKTTPKPVSDDDEEQGDVADESNHDEDGGASDDDTPVVVVSKTKKKSKKKNNRKLNSNKRMLDGDDNEDSKDKDPVVVVVHALLLMMMIVPSSTSSDLLCVGRDGFFADPEYCTRYYRCSHGIDEIFECPRGTAWDDVTKACSWADQVTCDERKLGYSTSSTTEDPTTSRKKSDTDAALTDANAAPGALATNGKDASGASASGIECQPTGIYSLPDPAECISYYQCSKGTLTKLSCSERTLFDVEKRDCVEYERVFCGTRSVNLSDKNQCVGKRDGIHPDTERDCHFYYQCVAQNKMREAKCPGDQKFSSYTGRCGAAGNAPIPCGSYAPGNAAMKNGMAVRILATMILFVAILHL